MKAIETLIRSDAWDRATKTAFLAWLDKPMRDTARLLYCERKAWFLSRAERVVKLRAAEKLLDWALARFVRADARTRSLARSTRGQIRGALRRRDR